MGKVLCLTVLMVTVAAGIVGGQERDLSSPYFDCPYINYFDSGCPELERHEVQTAPPPQVTPEPEEPAVGQDQEQEEYEWSEENPEFLVPLFPRESLSRDTPELYRVLLMKPTVENARRFVRWYSRRMERIRQVQGLIALAGGEFLLERAASE